MSNASIRRRHKPHRPRGPHAATVADTGDDLSFLGGAITASPGMLPFILDAVEKRVQERGRIARLSSLGRLITELVGRQMLCPVAAARLLLPVPTTSPTSSPPPRCRRPRRPRPPGRQRNDGC